jgi:hypothetical protein
VSPSACTPRVGKAPLCPLVHAASIHHGPEPHCPVHRIFCWRIIPKSINPCHFAKGPYSCSISTCSPQISMKTLRFSKKNPRYTPSHFLEITNKSPKLFSPYLCNHNSYFGDSCAKILRIFHSFISCIHNTCLLHIE